LFQPARSLTVSDGRIRTSADTAASALACGRCLRLAVSGYTLDAEADKRCRRSRAECSGHRQYQNALPAWLRNRRIICGSVTRHPAPIAWASRLHLFRSDRGLQGPPALRTRLRPKPPTTGRIRVTNPVLPGPPPPGRRVTLDNRRCQLIRRSGPDDWCGAAAGRRGHVRP
jgi:hypothetical protein